MFFQLLLGIKVRLVDKMMQSNYLCVRPNWTPLSPVAITNLHVTVKAGQAFPTLTN